ncbi:MAG: Hsp33 family molecular chaperone HslO [Kiritimatiellae bacterium]|nr:Hsp33 family molecular chaperone HslO [Kiritimatiellia bacterium]
MSFDCREEWYDASSKTAITIADTTKAAQALISNHLSGPVSAYYLTRALTAAALLSTELSEAEETLSIQMKCTGPLGGLNVECSAAGTLRGYAEKKILEDFDAVNNHDVRKVVGERRIQITRSLPGRILSQGIATTLDGYLSQSLQRDAEIRLEAEVSDESVVQCARGVMIERLPDAPDKTIVWPRGISLCAGSRKILEKLGFPHAELKKTTPLSFACRCSAERAASMLAALSDEERANLPPAIDVTCHLCGKIWTVRTK